MSVSAAASVAATASQDGKRCQRTIAIAAQSRATVIVIEGAVWKASSHTAGRPNHALVAIALARPSPHAVKGDRATVIISGDGDALAARRDPAGTDADAHVGGGRLLA